MKKVVMFISLFVVISIMISNSYNQVIIPKEAIRFRVIANSNSEYDQTNKKKIAKTLSTDMVEILKDTIQLMKQDLFYKIILLILKIQQN